MRDRKKARERAEALVSQMTVDEMASQLKFDAPAIERLGIPAYNWWRRTYGVARAGTATVIPTGNRNGGSVGYRFNEGRGFCYFRRSTCKI